MVVNRSDEESYHENESRPLLHTSNSIITQLGSRASNFASQNMQSFQQRKKEDIQERNSFFQPEGMHVCHKIGQQKTASKDFRIGLNNTSSTQIKTTAFSARILLRGFLFFEEGELKKSKIISRSFFIFRIRRSFESLLLKSLLSLSQIKFT